MTLIEFLIAAAENPHLQASFRDDPVFALAGSGLSAEDQQLILAGDPRKLLNAVFARRRRDFPFVSVSFAVSEPPPSLGPAVSGP